MIICAIREMNFYTEEHGLKNYVHFCHDFEDALEYLKENYGIDEAELGVEIVFEEDDGDSEYGEQSLVIEMINVGG